MVPGQGGVGVGFYRGKLLVSRNGPVARNCFYVFLVTAQAHGGLRLNDFIETYLGKGLSTLCSPGGVHHHFISIKSLSRPPHIISTEIKLVCCIPLRYCDQLEMVGIVSSKTCSELNDFGGSDCDCQGQKGSSSSSPLARGRSLGAGRQIPGTLWAMWGRNSWA